MCVCVFSDYLNCNFVVTLSSLSPHSQIEMNMWSKAQRSFFRFSQLSFFAYQPFLWYLACLFFSAGLFFILLLFLQDTYSPISETHFFHLFFLVFSLLIQVRLSSFTSPEHPEDKSLSSLSFSLPPLGVNQNY